MKFKLTLIVLAILSAQVYSQSKNSISVVYGTATNSVNIHGTIGDIGYDGKGGTAFGFTYERYLSKSFSLETGLLVSDDKIQVNYIISGGTETTPGDIKMISIPVLAKFTFFKYIFIDGGLIADFQTNYSYQPPLVYAGPIIPSPPTGLQPNYSNNAIVNNQSGIGLELGIGAKYNFGPVIITVNPYLQQHDFIQFNSNSNGNSSHYNLFDSGFKFALGYRF